MQSSVKLLNGLDVPIFSLVLGSDSNALIFQGSRQ